MTQIERIEDQVADLEAKQDRLIEKKDELQGRIEEFRTRKETMKARYQAAEASARVEEAMTGAGDEMGEINRTIERAEERTEDMEARAAALDELREKGALEDGLSDRSQLDRELEELSNDSAVDAELETLKSEVDGAEPDAESATDAETSEQQAAGTPAVDDAAVESELDDLKEEER
jgi:phage shock protein A